MQDKLVLPNDHKLDFDKFLFFEKGQNAKYFQVYFMPALIAEDNTVLPDLNHVLVFNIDDLKLLPKEDNFFERHSTISLDVLEQAFCDNIPTNFDEACQLGYSFSSLLKLSNRLMPITLLEMAMNESFEQFGFTDLVVGYYDENKKEFVQGMYLKDFVYNETYAILDYYLYTLEEEFFINEDIFDLRVQERTAHFKEALDFELLSYDINEIVNRLKLSCIESSFFSKAYSKDYEDMQEEVFYVLSKYIKDFHIQDDYQKILELSNYLRALNVLEFYVRSKESSEFYPIEKLLKAQHKKGTAPTIGIDGLKVAFHPRLRKMLNDRYN